MSSHARFDRSKGRARDLIEHVIEPTRDSWAKAHATDALVCARRWTTATLSSSTRESVTAWTGVRTGPRGLRRYRERRLRVRSER